MKHVILIFLALLSSCKNLDYKKPAIAQAPKEFLEAGVTWQEAKPNADYDRGQWWKIYQNNSLNDLEDKLNQNNQNIKAAEKTYQASFELIAQARAAYFPTIGGAQSITKEKVTQNNPKGKATYSYNKNHTLSLSSSWELDIFNQVKYSVNSNIATAKANQANWAAVKLANQATLAQIYFELRALDMVQKYLDAIATANLAGLKYEEKRYKAGIVNQLSLISYQNNYNTSLQNAQNNKITRAQYSHAIAVLIGESPSSFILPPEYDTNFLPVKIPSLLPSQLVEHRPDVARAEYQVMQANAAIGVARSAFIPKINLATTAAFVGNNHYGPLFDMPQFLWSVGPQLAFALFDGGARVAATKSAKATYEAQVATYRNAILSAFMEVEDQLVAVNYLNSQEALLDKNAINSKKNLKLTENQYKHGIIDLNAVLTAKVSYYNAAIALANVESIQKSSEIALIKALGGGWQEK